MPRTRFLFAAITLVFSALPATAQTPLETSLAAVVRLSAEVPGDARSARTLGTARDGHGVVIDDSGLILTIGYLILEATGVQVQAADGKAAPADIVAYDYDSGFGLVRSLLPLGVKPIPLGNSSELKLQDPVLVAGSGGPAATIGAMVVALREFAGYWEYLLEEAIFTAPPHPNWGGAALIGRDGKLYGIGSLMVGDAAGDDRPLPGNMFIPIDLLKPIFADLLSDGRASGSPKPWLGMYTTEAEGRLVVTQVSPDSPAQKAGIEPGDFVLAIAGDAVSSTADLYRKLWARGAAGVDVPLEIARKGAMQQITVTSGNRYDYLKLQRTY